MFASIVTGKGSDPGTEAEAAKYWKGLGEQKGYIRGYMLLDRSTGTWMTVNLWETEADAKSYETSGYQRDVTEAHRLGTTDLTRQVFEVIAEK